VRRKEINKVLENVVYHHLKTYGYSVFVGKLGAKEIDFVAEKMAINCIFKLLT
jgi:uncharacterized protein